MKGSGAPTQLRIAHVQPQTLDLYGHRDEELGGSVRYFVSNLAEAQIRLGHEPVIHLLTSSRRSKRLAFRGVDVRFHPCVQPPIRVGSRRFARQLSLALLRSLASDPPDIIHFHGVRQFHIMFGAVGQVARRRHVPMVAREDGQRPVGRLEGWAQRAGLRATGAVLAGNMDGFDDMTRHGFPRDRIFVVPNGFDPSVFHAGPVDPPRPHQPLRVLAVTRLSPEKDPLTLVRALQKVVALGREVSLTIAGEGPLRETVKRALEEAGVIFELIGHVSQGDLADHYRRAQVLCLSTLGEGSNQAVLEAMACGLPVVASDVGGVREVVGNVGRLVPPRNPERFAAALQHLTANSAEWVASRNAGLARSAAFTWGAIATAVDDVYGQVLRHEGIS